MFFRISAMILRIGEAEFFKRLSILPNYLFCTGIQMKTELIIEFDVILIDKNHLIISK